jgi:hypothetical protein
MSPESSVNADIESAIASKMNTPAYINRDDPMHKSIVEEVQRLFVKKNTFKK